MSEASGQYFLISEGICVRKYLGIVAAFGRAWNRIAVCLGPIRMFDIVAPQDLWQEKNQSVHVGKDVCIVYLLNLFLIKGSCDRKTN